MKANLTEILSNQVALAVIELARKDDDTAKEIIENCVDEVIRITIEEIAVTLADNAKEHEEIQNTLLRELLGIHI